jgi:hypothetical protein
MIKILKKGDETPPNKQQDPIENRAPSQKAANRLDIVHPSPPAERIPHQSAQPTR